VGEDEGSGSEASRNGMPQVKGLKELKKLPVGSEGFPGQAGRQGRETVDPRSATPPCPIFFGSFVYTLKTTGT